MSKQVTTPTVTAATILPTRLSIAFLPSSESGYGLTTKVAGRVARTASCSFLLTASMAQSIPPLEFTGELRNEGAPRVGFTRGGLHHAEGFEALLWTRPSTFPHVQLQPLRPHPRQDS